MIYVARRSCIATATPEDIFLVLSQPEGLMLLMPRLRKAEVRERHEDHANLMLCIFIGSMLGTVCCEGVLRWVEPREMVFDVRTTLRGTIRWLLETGENGTDVNVILSLDLKPLLGPMIHFLPRHSVERTIGNELDQAFRDLSVRFAACTDPLEVLPQAHVVL